MEKPKVKARSELMNKIKGEIKLIPTVFKTRQAIEQKAEKRRKRKESLAMNPNDMEAINEENKQEYQLRGEQKKEKFLKKYEFMEKIGEGSNGVVRKCRNKINNKIYAVKCMELNEEHCLFLKKNFKYIRNLDHPNIIKYKALYLDLQKRNCYLVMEYETMPSLEYFQNLTEEEMQQIMKQLLDILHYIHSKNICHRDIKPDNILYDRQNKKIKLIDFGISKKIITREQKQELLTITGTLFYRAPQMFLGGGYDESVDIWAAGITLYKLIIGKTPFESQYVVDTIENITNNKVDFSDFIWELHSKFVKDLIYRLLVKDRGERLSAAQAKKHFWFSQKFDDSQVKNDPCDLKLRKIQTSKQIQIGRKRQELYRKNSQIPETSQDSIETAKKKINTWMDDGSSDDDSLVEVNSEGQQIKKKKKNMFGKKKEPKTVIE